MPLAERLRRLDDRVVPDLGRGRYDAPRPPWILYGGVIAVFLTFGAILSYQAGGWWLLLTVPCALAFVVLLAVTTWWARLHRIVQP